MTLIEKIPELDDDGLRNLLANARRLQETGSPKQQEQAAELLPALEEAAAARQAEKLEAAAAKRAAKRTVKKEAAH
ncbi:MAG TPA: hypothetical protein VIO94_12895 [Phenylobacterium sp.]